MKGDHVGQRKVVIEWDDPAQLREARAKMGPLEFTERMASGELPRAPVQALLGSRLVEVGDGFAVMELECGEQLANPYGTVHGAVLGHLIDAGGGFAINSRLPAAARSTSFDLRTTFLRPVPATAGVLRCEATAIHVGGRIPIADGRVLDAEERVCAHGTVMYLVTG
jgi:uncharacterized protein (TIGR00369 family)